VQLDKPLLIIKTGNTIPTLLAQGIDFEHWFAAGCGLSLQQCHVVSLFLGEPLPDLEEIAGIIVTGSPAYVTDLEPWNLLGADYIRRAHLQSIPILGICYGHQLLAWAFGGKVDFNAAGRQIGTVVASLSTAAAADRLLSGLPGSLLVQVSHQQSVTQRPANAILLASRDADPNHGFRLGATTWGLQFHPEFSAAITCAYIEERKTTLEREGLDTGALLAGLKNTSEAAGILERFAALMAESKPAL